MRQVQGRFRESEAQVVQLGARLAALSAELEREQQEKMALVRAGSGRCARALTEFRVARAGAACLYL